MKHFSTGLLVTGISTFGGSEDAAWTGVFIVMSGIIIDFVAIPVWITGAVRKNNLKNSPHYQSLQLESLYIAPALGRNHFSNTYSVGLRASFRF